MFNGHLVTGQYSLLQWKVTNNRVYESKGYDQDMCYVINRKSVERERSGGGAGSM